MHRSASRVLTVVIAAVVTVMWSAGAAFAVPTWKVQATPLPGAAAGGLFGDVSCVSATLCTAVGRSLDSSGRATPLAERWDGTSWTVQSVSDPTGDVADPILSAVSCTSASACMAVGWGNGGSALIPFSERWNGTTWSIVSMPTPNVNGSAQLRDISCVSATVCFAVGAYYDGSKFRPFSERWNGTSWALRTVPQPTGATTSELSGVQCKSASFCVAVGYFTTATVTSRVLALRWNGTSWSATTAAVPAASSDSGFSGVSCTSTTACAAVGYYSNSSARYVTLVERWNGSKWTVQASPTGPGTVTNELLGVSCVSASACAAVGYSRSGSNPRVVLAERWNGTRWAITPTPAITGSTGAVLGAVSCTAATACTAVDYFQDASHTYTQLLAERYA